MRQPTPARRKRITAVVPRELGDHMQVMIASHRLKNNDGTINIRGKKQIILEWGPSRSDLLLTMNLYAEGGKHVARLRRNEWTFNDHSRFSFVSDQRCFRITDTASGRVALRGRVEGRDSVVITEGTFYSGAGEQVEITQEHRNKVEASDPAPAQPTQPTKHPYSPDEIAPVSEWHHSV
jgi:hypothetical protein